MSPFGTVVRRSPSSRRTVSTVGLILGQERFPGELHTAALVHLEQLDLDDVALLDHVLGLLGAAVLQLADMEQPFDAGEDFHEGAERGRALDRPLVGPADLGLGGDGRDHRPGLLAGLGRTLAISFRMWSRPFRAFSSACSMILRSSPSILMSI